MQEGPVRLCSNINDLLACKWTIKSQLNTAAASFLLLNASFDLLSSVSVSILYTMYKQARFKSLFHVTIVP